METIYEFAEFLHSKKCPYSHIDQCSWEYELAREDLWNQWAHKYYLDKANKVKSDLYDIPFDLIVRIVNAL